MKNLRHGDLNFIKEEVDTKGLKVVGKQNVTLSEGEKTGHLHQLTAVKESVVEVFEGKNGELIIKVEGKAVLTHPEHKTLEFPTGVWRMDKEEEFDYFAMATRKVID